METVADFQYDLKQLLADVIAETGATVMELHPGDLVNQGHVQSTFVAQTVHPLWPHLRLVVWRVPESLGLPGNWSHDALDPRQVVGTVVPATPYERTERLRAALLGGGDRG